MWNGIPAFHYVGGVDNFKAAKDFPPNICFCEDTGDESPECLKSGAFDLYNCLGSYWLQKQCGKGPSEHG
jgi:hypothetical protein